jgi:hypothetical protein
VTRFWASASAALLIAQAAVRRFAIDLGGIDNCDGDRQLNVEAGGQEHTQWLARFLALPVLTLPL